MHYLACTSYTYNCCAYLYTHPFSERILFLVRFYEKAQRGGARHADLRRLLRPIAQAVRGMHARVVLRPRLPARRVGRAPNGVQGGRPQAGPGAARGGPGRADAAGQRGADVGAYAPGVVMRSRRNKWVTSAHTPCSDHASGPAVLYTLSPTTREPCLMTMCRKASSDT